MREAEHGGAVCLVLWDERGGWLQALGEEQDFRPAGARAVIFPDGDRGVVDADPGGEFSVFLPAILRDMHYRNFFNIHDAFGRLAPRAGDATRGDQAQAATFFRSPNFSVVIHDSPSLLLFLRPGLR